MNVNNTNNIHTCTSCQLCAAVCPVSAINIILNTEGFYRPVIDEEKCIDCSLCSKVCYKYNDVSLTTEQELCTIDLLAVMAKDSKVIDSTTSGGVAYLLAKKMFEQGYKCAGVVYDTDCDNAEHIIAKIGEDIESFKGSKYIQSYTYSTFKQLVNQCSNDKIAVFGTPCQIYAIDRFLRLRNRRNSFLLVDIYCHGCPSLLLWQKYVREIKNNIKKVKLDRVDFRSKIRGWGNFHVVLIADGLRVFISNRKKDEFYQLFFSNYMLNDACADCQLRSTLNYTDIRLGDFWGKCYDDNTKGVSAVTLVTDRGRKAFEKIENEVIVVKKHIFDDFLPFQSWRKNYKINDLIRQHLFDKLKEEVPLLELLHYYQTKQPFFQKTKRYLKNTIFFCSPQVINFLKKIYHHF